MFSSPRVVIAHMALSVQQDIFMEMVFPTDSVLGGDHGVETFVSQELMWHDCFMTELVLRALNKFLIVNQDGSIQQGRYKFLDLIS